VTTPAPIRQRRKEARPAELLAAALEVFADKGFAAARMDDIAQRAGVSKGTVFLYYESKQALFRAVVEDAVVPHIVSGEALVEASSEEDPAVLLRNLLLRYWNVLADPRLEGLPRLIMAEAGNFPELASFYHENVIVRARTLFINVLEHGIQTGVFRPCDPAVMCRLAVAPLMFDCMWRRLLPPSDPLRVVPDTYVQTHLDMFLSNLLASPLGERNDDEK